ncbi:MAG: hypothetical protein RIR26_1686 [Pseudomonadota bacterium]
MVRINLIRNKVRQSSRSEREFSLPRVVAGSVVGLVAISLWACSDSNFKGSQPVRPSEPPKRNGSELVPSPAEPGTQPEEKRQESPPLDPRRTLQLQITGVQPESWWNNCLKIELAGKTFDIGCSKEANVIGKTVKIAIPEGTECPVLNLKMETFVNVGSECATRAQSGLSCMGPFEATPRFSRSYESAADRGNFVLSETALGGTGRTVRVYFEDQPLAKLNEAKSNPTLAEELGIDFNDAIFDIKTTELPFEISGAPSTRCGQK